MRREMKKNRPKILISILWCANHYRDQRFSVVLLKAEKARLFSVEKHVNDVTNVVATWKSSVLFRVTHIYTHDSIRSTWCASARNVTMCLCCDYMFRGTVNSIAYTEAVDSTFNRRGGVFFLSLVVHKFTTSLLSSHSHSPGLSGWRLSSFSSSQRSLISFASFIRPFIALFLCCAHFIFVSLSRCLDFYSVFRQHILDERTNDRKIEENIVVELMEEV